MAHRVTFAIPSRDLGRADVKFDVWAKQKLGTLAVSKGSVVWFPRDHSYGYKVPWVVFDKLMTEHGTKGPEKR